MQAIRLAWAGWHGPATRLQKRIDVWWGGREHNWSLMVLLATLIQSSIEWEGSRVRLLVVVDSDEDIPTADKKLQRALARSRLRAETEVFTKKEPSESPFEVIRRESHDASLMLLGLRAPEPEEGEGYLERLTEMLEGLGSVLLVRASSRFRGTDVLFEIED